MQTIGRYDPPRNRSTYEVVLRPYLGNVFNRHARYWLAVNAANYWTWSALRRNTFLKDQGVEREADKARARYYLALARKFRGDLWEHWTN